MSNIKERVETPLLSSFKADSNQQIKNSGDGNKNCDAQQSPDVKTGAKNGGNRPLSGENPSIDEVETYIKTQNLKIDGAYFYRYFAAAPSGFPRNWKQRAISWSANERHPHTATSPAAAEPPAEKAWTPEEQTAENDRRRQYLESLGVKF